MPPGHIVLVVQKRCGADFPFLRVARVSVSYADVTCVDCTLACVGSQTLPEDVDVSSGRQQMPSRPFMPFAPGPSGDNTENEIEGVGDTPKPQRTAPVVGRRRFRPFVPPLSPNRPRPNRRTRISGAYAHRASTGSSDERGSAGLLDKDEMLNRQTEVNPALRRTRHTLRQVGTDDDDNHTGGLMNGERELVRMK